MNSKISIIIPTYNRAHLIGETLRSISLQTYQNWECLIIDDGSTDHTQNVLIEFTQADARFKFFSRPTDKPKGANACRNYGFEISTGDYVIWFDSDDIMLTDKLSKHLSLIEQKSLDFSIGSYQDFTDSVDEHNSKVVLATDPSVSLNSYITGKTFWGTIDFLSRRDFIGNVRFNENLRSGQEYNFFITLLAGRKWAGEFINEIVAMRRIHPNSIQQVQIQNRLLRLKNKFWIYWETYRSNHPKLDREASIFLLQKSAIYFHKLCLLRNSPIPLSVFINTVSREIGLIKAANIGALLFLAKILSRGDVFGSRIIKKTIS